MQLIAVNCSQLNPQVFNTIEQTYLSASYIPLKREQYATKIKNNRKLGLSHKKQRSDIQAEMLKFTQRRDVT